MFHAINVRLVRLARRMAPPRIWLADEYATWYGWQTRPAGWGAREFRDPRFDQLVTASRTWAQEAITGRIRGLGTPSDHTPVAGRGA
jgi:hypothetical protein